MKVYIIRSDSSLDHEGSADIVDVYADKTLADNEAARLMAEASRVRALTDKQRRALDFATAYLKWMWYEVEEWDVLGGSQ